MGGTELYTVDEAREDAREAIKAIKTGGNRDGVETFEAVASEWIKRHVEKKGLISAPEHQELSEPHSDPGMGRSRVRIDQAQRCCQASG